MLSSLPPLAVCVPRFALRMGFRFTRASSGFFRSQVHCSEQGVASPFVHGSTNLHFGSDLSLARSLRKAKSGASGHGAKQAPVAQPVMLLRLEEALVAAIRERNPRWTALYATWLQVMGCVRITHVQRSRLVSMDGHTMYWECVPVSEDFDFGAAYVDFVQGIQGGLPKKGPLATS